MESDVKLETDENPATVGKSEEDGKSKKHKNPEIKFDFLKIVSRVVLIYFSLKFIIFPFGQIVVNIANKDKISADVIKIPDFTFPDITLLAIVLLFRPETSEVFKSIDLSTGGIRADFTKLETKVEEVELDLNMQQQKQIEAMNELQNFMYTLILSANEIEKLRGIKNNTMTSFNVSKDAAAELRRLRNSDLIRIKSNAKHISDLEKASNYGELAIDLTKYCELTKTGVEYLQNLEKIISQKRKEAS